MSHCILLFSLLTFFSVLGYSNEISQAERTCRLVFPEKPANTPKFVYLFDGEQNHKVYISAVNFSDIVHLKAGDITLVMAPEPISDPEKIPRTFPHLTLSKEIKNFYILLSHDAQNSVLPISMNVLNLESGKFNEGTTLWYNFTNHRIAAKLGESKIIIDARKSAVSAEPLSTNGYYVAEFGFQPNSAGEFRRITEQQWWFDASCRYVGFIVDRGARLPRIYVFRDFRSKLE